MKGLKCSDKYFWVFSAAYFWMRREMQGPKTPRKACSYCTSSWFLQSQARDAVIEVRSLSRQHCPSIQAAVVVLKAASSKVKTLTNIFSHSLISNTSIYQPDKTRNSVAVCGLDGVGRSTPSVRSSSASWTAQPRGDQPRVDIPSQVVSRASSCANWSFCCLQDGSRRWKKPVRYHSIPVEGVLRRHHDKPTKTKDRQPVTVLADKTEIRPCFRSAVVFTCRFYLLPGLSAPSATSAIISTPICPLLSWWLRSCFSPAFSSALER